MAQQYTTQDGITLTDPGTYVSQKVISNQSGTAASGVITLVGEADEGPHWSEEADIDQNTFGPDQIADVIAKYGSGRLVDAFNAVVDASSDPAIVGAVSEVKLVKTNVSGDASSAINRPGFGLYATEYARREGKTGNLTKYLSQTAQAEVSPMTGAFAYGPLFTGSVAFNLRTNGGTSKAITVTASEAPDALASAIEDTTLGILVQGGVKSLPLTGLVGDNITATSPNASTLVVSLDTGTVFASTPAVGDTVVLANAGQYGATSASSIAGTANANLGSYIVTSVSNTVTSAAITLKKLHISGASTIAAAGVINAQTDDIIAYNKMNIQNYTGQVRPVSTGNANWTTTSNDGTNVVLSSSVNWTANPQVGDYMTFASTFAGILAGFYIVVSSTSSTVSFARLSNGSAGTTGSASAAPAGFVDYKPVIDGTGKTLEFQHDISTIFFDATGTGETFGDTMLVSAAEYENQMTVSNGNASSSFQSGGDIMIKVGSTSANAHVVVSADQTEFFSGATSLFVATFDQYPTMSSLVDYINSQTTFNASLGSNRFSNNASSSLDLGTYYMNTYSNNQTARIKADAVNWAAANSQSAFAIPTLNGQSGLPEDISPEQFLSGGSKGGSTSAAIAAAIDACNDIDTNFVVSLFSQDASQDIIDGETETSSTYTIDAINSLMESNAIENSKLEARKNRQSFGSRLGSFAAQQEAAGEVSSNRMSMCIEDTKVVNASGTLTWFQPWMTAVIAAGMQAAAGYKGIVKKRANITGKRHRYGDFNSKSLQDRKTALKAGLLFMEAIKTGGFRWVSDQTTYSADNNFVYNSIQAVYVADLMTLSMIETFDTLVVGQSIAEITAQGALAILEAEMFNFFRLRWITSSDDAPRGFKNAVVRLNGGVMQISLEAKLAGLIYFVPINFAISQVTQTASSAQ